MKIIKFLDEHEWAVVLLCIFIVFSCICIYVDTMIARLYEVQAEIVIHDYGHVFETIEDWKLEKIEKYKKLKEVEK